MKKLIGIVVLGLLFSGNAYSEDNYFIKTAKEFNREFIKAKTANEAIYHMQKLNQMVEEASIISDKCYTAIMDSRISYPKCSNTIACSCIEIVCCSQITKICCISR